MEHKTTEGVHIPRHHRRPLLITVLCSFYFVFWAIGILSYLTGLFFQLIHKFPGPVPSFMEFLNQIPPLFIGARLSDINLITWLTVAGLVVGVIGYWFYKKWAVIVYSAASVAFFIIALPSPAGLQAGVSYVAVLFYTILSLLAINIALIALGVIHFRKME